MIRAKHVRDELREGLEKFENAKSVEEKVNVIFKLITVTIKLILSTRVNTSLIMKKVGAEPLPSRRRDETSTDAEPRIAPKKEKE